jgi:hypothetical protein
LRMADFCQPLNTVVQRRLTGILDSVGQKGGVSAVARRIRESILDSRDARLKLKIRGKPYWRSIGSGLHVGYRKGKDVRRWVARVYVGSGQYVVEAIGHADDVEDADGVNVLTLWQAQDRARQLASKRTTAAGQRMGPYTVSQAIKDYLDHIAMKPSHYEVKKRLDAYVTPKLARTEVSKLAKADIVTWHRGIASQPPPRSDEGRRITALSCRRHARSRNHPAAAGQCQSSPGNADGGSQSCRH